MIAEIIAAGSEMLTPHRQDTNSLFLTEQLNNLGVEVAFKTIVGDSLDHLTGAARIALARADLVLLSGGLGPTEDDLTREAVAAALGLSLHRQDDLLDLLRKRFAARSIAMLPNNLKQADLLQGAVILPNRAGSAVGQFLHIAFEGKPRTVILLPGPPNELKAVFEEARPRLTSTLPAHHLARRQLRMALIPESQVDARTAPIYKQYADVETTILAGSGEIQLHFVCTKPTEAEAQARVDELAARVEREMGDSIFSSGGESLPEIIHALLRARELDPAVAESCTGGLLSQRLTAVPNSSGTFLGGAVVYTTELKTEFAGVPKQLIDTVGSVSPEVAKALAEGIRTRCDASFGISITGLAGPGGGPPGPDERKPIGLVYIGLADKDGTDCLEVNIPGDRERVRLWATQHALEMLRRKLL